MKKFTLFGICRENELRTFGTCVADKIYALRPESFCASKSADRKVETFQGSDETMKKEKTMMMRLL